MKLIFSMKVFRQYTKGCYPIRMQGIEFSRVNELELQQQGQLPDDVFERQTSRLRRFGASYCYGAFVNGDLAAFAWLLPPDAMVRDIPHLLTGRPGEAELTAAETLPKYRGRGLYGFVLVNTFSAARANGIHTVLFKTYPENRAALRSFAKIGATYVGTTYFAFLPGLKNPIVWPRQFQ